MTSSTTSPRADSAYTHHVADGGVVRGALGLTLVSLVGFGLLYPLAGVGLGQAFFPVQSNGSIVLNQGKAVGSVLVAQPFAGDQYFQPRPSAAGYNPMAASGSNQARTNPELRQRIEDARAAVAQREGVDPSAVPSDLVTQSGGGLDPHISPESAAIQVSRVARVRGLRPEQVQQFVTLHTESRQWGLLGQPRVNVLLLNRALDAQRPDRAAPQS